jgi:hypothetical protein
MWRWQGIVYAARCSIVAVGLVLLDAALFAWLFKVDYPLCSWSSSQAHVRMSATPKRVFDSRRHTSKTATVGMQTSLF